jgi:hypothetical protein
VSNVANRPESVWGTRGVRVITLVTIFLMAGSLSTYADWLASAKHHGGLTLYLGVIALILVGWASGVAFLRRRFERIRDPA